MPSNEYMKEYMLKRYHARMETARIHLGGKCTRCPATAELDFDHIDPKDKSFTIGSLWSCSMVKFWEEIDKCQLLCKVCHEQKTLDDNNQISAKTSHGTLSSYRYCKCPLCKQANTDYMIEYYKTHERHR